MAQQITIIIVIIVVIIMVISITIMFAELVIKIHQKDLVLVILVQIMFIVEVLVSRIKIQNFQIHYHSQ